MSNITVSEARTHFYQILDQVQRGDEFVISRHGKPVARLMSSQQTFDKQSADKLTLEAHKSRKQR